MQRAWSDTHEGTLEAPVYLWEYDRPLGFHSCGLFEAKARGIRGEITHCVESVKMCYSHTVLSGGTPVGLVTDSMWYTHTHTHRVVKWDARGPRHRLKVVRTHEHTHTHKCTSHTITPRRLLQLQVVRSTSPFML